MSFGFGFGDFVTAIELANKVRSRFVDAPGQFSAISKEIKDLSNVLRDIEDILPQRDLPGKQRDELSEVAKSCGDVLRDLENILDKNQEIITNPSGISGRSKKVWKRLLWDQEEIEDFRKRITSNLLSLNTFLGKINIQTTSAVKDGVDRIISHQREEDDLKLLNWLPSVDYGLEQSDILSRRQPGTGQWLLDSASFRDWSSGSFSTLFCPGLPGSGKTIMSSIVIDHICTMYKADPDIGVAYIYCNFRRRDEQKPVTLLSSLVKQLTQNLLSIPSSLKRLYEHHKPSNTQPSLKEVSEVLRSIVSGFSKCFILVDALDECQAADGTRRTFLEELFKLQEQASVRLLVTSRPIPEIANEFKSKGTSLEVRASDQDVNRFLDSNMAELPPFVLRNIELQDQIKNEIISASEGMFLLAKLHLDALQGIRSLKALRKALATLSTGSNAYDEVYEDSMHRIRGQNRNSREFAEQILSWITCAKRPLTTQELQHALAVELETDELDEENVPEIDDMVSVCAGLVTVDEESRIIRLIHQTTQEYFERTQDSWFPNAHSVAASVCLTYLSFSIFETGYCEFYFEFKERLEQNRLYHYATQNWAYHLQRSREGTKDLLQKFLENDSCVESAFQAIVEPEYSRYDMYDQPPTRVCGIHLAAYFGLEEALATSLEKEENPDTSDNYRLTPLMWAATNGHTECVRLLLATPGVSPGVEGRHARTALSFAAENNHETIVELLLRADEQYLDLKDTQGRTALIWATRRGNRNLLKLILQNDIDINASDCNEDTVLHYLAARGCAELLEVLLEHKADIEVRNSDGLTPLLVAVSHSQLEAVRFLLNSGANAHVSDSMNRGALHLIDSECFGDLDSSSDRVATAQLFLSHGSSANTVDKNNMTPLHYQIKRERADLAKLLIDYGVPVDNYINRRAWKLPSDTNVDMSEQIDEGMPVLEDAEVEHGLTPLHLAALENFSTMAEFLLGIGANPNVVSQYGITPLHFAIEKTVRSTEYIDDVWKEDTLRRHKGVHDGENILILRKLLEGGANVDACNDQGQTALHLAFTKFELRSAEILLGNHASIVRKDNQGWNAFHYSAKSSPDLLSLLFQVSGHDFQDLVNSKDNDGRTPLHHMLDAQYRPGHLEGPQLLLDHGADINSPDRFGMPPLPHYLQAVRVEQSELDDNPYAEISRHEARPAAIEFCLKNGADPLFRTSDGRNLAHITVASGIMCVSTLKTLKEHGVDLNGIDSKGRNILHFAAINDTLTEKLLKFILSNTQLQLETLDLTGKTALKCAIETDEGHPNESYRAEPVINDYTQGKLSSIGYDEIDSPEIYVDGLGHHYFEEMVNKSLWDKEMRGKSKYLYSFP